MPRYVLADGAEKDLEGIARYTIDHWGIDQARTYGAAFARHFDSLQAGQVRSKVVFDHWAELKVSRCQHHYVFSLNRDPEPLAILAVFHESMDLLSRLRDRLDEDGMQV